MSLRSPGVPKRAYYPSLDGLRAVAVIMVFFQHYGAGHAFLFGWGWTGVDIFFVLSGFLITGILFDNQTSPHRFRDFYVRRTLRIFPLYYFLWIAIAILAPIAHWQWSWRWSLWPAYLGNYARFLFLHRPGNPYRFDMLTFGPRINAHFGYPVHLYIGHLWSLCVEEQFYLLWPLLVYRICSRDTLMKLCLAVILLSPILRAVLCVTVPPRYLEMELLYRSLPTRLDALLLGGLVALALRTPGNSNLGNNPQGQLLRRLRRPVLIGAALLLLALYLLETRILGAPFHGSATNWMGIFGFTLVDLIAAALILECIHPGTLLGRVLSLKPLRALGLISYGFYVYHDLLHDFYTDTAHRLSPAHPFPITLFLAFAGTLVIATTSYLVLEQPLLRLKDRFSSEVHTAPQA